MTRHASGKAERLLVELEVSAGRQEEAMRDLEVRVRRVAHLERRARTERNVWRSAALLLGGVFLLARQPRVRQGILDLAGRYNPATRDRLLRMGHRIRMIIGEVWIERLDESGAPVHPAAWSVTAETGQPVVAGGGTTRCLRKICRSRPRTPRNMGRTAWTRPWRRAFRPVTRPPCIRVAHGTEQTAEPTWQGKTPSAGSLGRMNARRDNGVSRSRQGRGLRWGSILNGRGGA